MTKLLETGCFSNPSVIVTINEVESIPKSEFSNMRKPLVEDNENTKSSMAFNPWEAG